MMQSKKAAILGTRGIPSRYGGFETFAEELAARLASRGIEVIKNVYTIIDEWIETAKSLGREVPEPKGKLAYA
jgi:hypothetical protein